MAVAGYDTCIVEKYHGNKSKVKVTKIVKNTESLIAWERQIVEMSNWCQNIFKTNANKNHISDRTASFDIMTYFGVKTKFLTPLRVFDKLSDVRNTSCRTFWHHDVFVTSWRTFWCHLMSRFDVFVKSCTFLWRQDVFLTSWRTFWRHNVFLTNFSTFRKGVIYLWIRQISMKNSACLHVPLHSQI